MENNLSIGAKLDKATTENLASFIDKVFSSAAKNRMDQGTVLAALSMAGTTLKIENVTVKDCVFEGEKTITN